MNDDVVQRYANSKYAERISKLSADDQLELFGFSVARFYRDRDAGCLVDVEDIDACVAYLERIDEAYFLHKKLDITYEHKNLTDLETGEHWKFNAKSTPEK